MWIDNHPLLAMPWHTWGPGDLTWTHDHDPDLVSPSADDAFFFPRACKLWHKGAHGIPELNAPETTLRHIGQRTKRNKLWLNFKQPGCECWCPKTGKTME